MSGANSIEPIPDTLMREPLAWFFAEHYRHRQLCLMIDRIANSKLFEEEAARAALAFIAHDLPLHILDEEEDFFPLLRRRCAPEDMIENVLGVLSADHTADLATAADVRRLLERSLRETCALGIDPGAQRALKAFSDQERRHLTLENAVVLPIARLRIGEGDLKALGERLAARRGAAPGRGGDKRDVFLEANLRWAAARAQAGEAYFEPGAHGPGPRVLWIGCCECVWAPHDLIGLEAREVLVSRNPANMAPADLASLAALQFAVERQCVQHILVCGHYDCDPVRASLEPPGNSIFDQWLDPLRGLAARNERALLAIADMRARANDLSERNVSEQVVCLARNPIVRAAWRRGQTLSLRGAVLSHRDGILREIVAPVTNLAEASALEASWMQAAAAAPRPARGGK
jgi:carbonic anhydrase/hemerythrin-like domain-containing protein